MIRTLIVDDDALTLELHRDYVERLDGFVVGAECAGARAAMTAVLDHPDAFDLVLLDITMPDGSGIDVLRALRSRSASVDVIAITSVRDADTVRSDAGGDRRTARAHHWHHRPSQRALCRISREGHGGAAD